MEENEKKFLEAQEAQIRALQTSAQQGQSSQVQQAMYVQDQEKGMIKEQLDLTEEWTRIENLIRGKYLKIVDGQQKWAEPTDSQMIIFTEYGVQKILQFLSWYMSKNTLLSNYDDETIRIKMEDLSISLADNLFMKYDEVFYKPTFDDCKKVFDKRIEEKKKILKFANELLGQEKSEGDIEKDLLEEMKDRIEREFAQIREKLMKDKLKEYELIIREIQDTIHSSYNRAYKGIERKSLREHVHISEMKGGTQPLQQPTKLNPLNWFKQN